MIISDFSLKSSSKKSQISEKKPTSRTLFLDKNNKNYKEICLTCFNNNLLKIGENILEKKYFPAFFFYFAKPINEILSNIETSHVILFKDYLYDDEENEYLKKFYKKNESSERIKILAEFYSEYKEIRANVCVVEQRQIIQKRFQKKEKIKQNLEKKQSNKDFFIENNKILENLSSFKNTSNNNNSQMNYNKEKHKNLIKFITNQTENSLKQSIYLNVENIVDYFEENTFNTTVHDVYEPMFTLTNENNKVVKDYKNNFNFEKNKKKIAEIDIKKCENNFIKKRSKNIYSNYRKFDLLGGKIKISEKIKSTENFDLNLLKKILIENNKNDNDNIQNINKRETSKKKSKSKSKKKLSKSKSKLKFDNICSTISTTANTTTRLFHTARQLSTQIYNKNNINTNNNNIIKKSNEKPKKNLHNKNFSISNFSNTKKNPTKIQLFQNSNNKTNNNHINNIINNNVNYNNYFDKNCSNGKNINKNTNKNAISPFINLKNEIENKNKIQKSGSETINPIPKNKVFIYKYLLEQRENNK